MLIDGHVHLDALKDVDSAIRRAGDAGIEKIVGVGMDLASNRKILALAGRFAGFVLPAVGYHPWSIRKEDMQETLDHIERCLEYCVALGEVGLDYRVKVKKRLQREVFERLLDLAARLDKPVIIHTRFSQSRCLDMVTAAGVRSAVFHWYSGPLDILEQILDRGFFVSATPALAFSRNHRAAIQAAPMDRILIETDAPVAYNGEVSEPSFLIRTVRALAGLKGIPEEEVVRATSGNMHRFLQPAPARAGRFSPGP